MMKEILKPTLQKLTVIIILATLGAIADVQNVKRDIKSLQVQAESSRTDSQLVREMLCSIAIKVKALKGKDKEEICRRMINK